MLLAAHDADLLLSSGYHNKGSIGSTENWRKCAEQTEQGDAERVKGRKKKKYRRKGKKKNTKQQTRTAEELEV